MKRLSYLLACTFLLISQVNGAEKDSFTKSKLVTMKNHEQNVVNVDLRFSDFELLVFKRGKSELLMQIPYSSIRSISYEYAERHRIEEGLFLGAPLMTTKNRSHWLAVSNGQDTISVFRLHKDEFRDILSAFGTKSGKSIEFLEDKGGLANPTAGSTDVDQIVPYHAEAIFRQIKPAMEKYNCQVTKEKPEKKARGIIECKRPHTVSGWKPGADAGPTGVGGEKVTVILEAMGKQTRIKVETGKGFAGRLRKKNWSTPVFNEIMHRLEFEMAP